MSSLDSRLHLIGHLRHLSDAELLERLPETIASRITVAPRAHPDIGTPCWNWCGRFNRNGYGRVWYQGREPVVHRVTWLILVGEVAEGLLLDHCCRNRACSSPLHLEPVTPRVNTLRGGAILFRPAARRATGCNGKVKLTG